MSLDFFVRGEPAPGGSKKAFCVRNRAGQILFNGNTPVIRIVDDGKHNAEWRRDVERAARIAHEGGPYRGPLRLVVEFVMPRPKSHFNAAGDVKPSAPIEHTQAPDTTKLLRAAEDAIAAAGVVFNDSQFIQHQTSKRWNRPGEVPGARIKITAPVQF